MKLRASLSETPHDSSCMRVGARDDFLVALGNGEFRSHRLDAEEVVIGRDASCDFVIDHLSLSRRHAIVRLSPAMTIQDLGSTNGTRVTARTLRGGDPVMVDESGFRIGPYAFVVLAVRAGGNLSRVSGDLLHVDDPTRAGATPLVRGFATSDVNILIVGESGVGKEVLAATVHELSARTGRFIQINCAALSESLLESELFGYERGAFTGATAQKRGLIEAAAGGSLLLDEIGELPLATQAKLLRVIEQREVLRLGSTQPMPVDVRFIAATNRDLVAAVAAGTFRADLFYRLDGVTLCIPPLRERPGAIVPLALGFLEAVRPGARLDTEVVGALTAHTWPGNVRELKAAITRAAILAGAGEIAVGHLKLAARDPRSSVPALAPTDHPADADAAERARIVDALADCAGNQSRAAKQLGISRTTLITKLRIYKIPRPTR
jgi:two-component system, NtrC family, response regulator AtoC